MTSKYEITTLNRIDDFSVHYISLIDILRELQQQQYTQQTDHTEKLLTAEY